MQQEVRIAELLPVVDLERPLEDVVAASDAVLKVAFAVAREGPVHLELVLQPVPLRARRKMTDCTKAAAVPVDRVLVPAHVLAQ
jgi:hypothetical protein